MDGNAPSVLVIDDYELVGHLVTLLLGREGFSVHTAKTGAEGLRQLASRSPQLILLDDELAEMTGLEVFRRLRKAGFTAPVMVLHNRPSTSFDGVTIKPDAYLFKPFRPRELLLAVKPFLSRRPLMSAPLHSDQMVGSP